MLGDERYIRNNSIRETEEISGQIESLEHKLIQVDSDIDRIRVKLAVLDERNNNYRIEMESLRTLMDNLTVHVRNHTHLTSEVRSDVSKVRADVMTRLNTLMITLVGGIVAGAGSVAAWWLNNM